MTKKQYVEEYKKLKERYPNYCSLVFMGEGAEIDHKYIKSLEKENRKLKKTIKELEKKMKVFSRAEER